MVFYNFFYFCAISIKNVFYLGGWTPLLDLFNRLGACGNNHPVVRGLCNRLGACGNNHPVLRTPPLDRLLLGHNLIYIPKLSALYFCVF